VPTREALARLCEEASTFRVIDKTTRSEVSIAGGSIVTGPSEVIGNSCRWFGTVEPPLIPGRSRKSLPPVARAWSGWQPAPVGLVVGAAAAAGGGLGVGVLLAVLVRLDAGLDRPGPAGG
jgi:hypothetical protein